MSLLCTVLLLLLHDHIGALFTSRWRHEEDKDGCDRVSSPVGSEAYLPHATLVLLQTCNLGSIDDVDLTGDPLSTELAIDPMSR